MARILIVEDDENLREIVTEVLEREGYEVVVAENGDEGIGKLIEFGDTIDAIITDLEMPVLDGRYVLKFIHDNMPEVPAIMITGLAGYEKEAKAAGAKAVIVKPASIRDIRAEVKKYIKGG